VAHIVVTNEVIALNFDPKVILLCRKALAKKIVTDSNAALLDKVHVCNFIFLINYQINRFLLVEFLGLETEADVVEEFGVTILIRVKEEAMLKDDIIEKVLSQYVVLYSARTLIQIFIIFINTI
jgi:hypothetical protein